MNLRMLRESSLNSVGDGITQEECDAMVKRIDELIAGGADPDRALPGVIIDLDAPFPPPPAVSKVEPPPWRRVRLLADSWRDRN